MTLHMKTYFLLLLLPFAAGIFSCKKEATPPASADVADAYVRLDNPANEADHQSFLLYQETGIPVLFTDTLSKDPLALLNYRYLITGTDSLLTVRFVQTTADRVAGVNFIRNEILPHLSKNLYPYSILLADSVYSYIPAYPSRKMVAYNAYPALSSLLISQVSNISTMIPDSIKTYRRDILKGILLQPLANSDLLKAFFAVSKAYYGKYASGTTTSGSYIPYQVKEVYGLLTNGSEYPGYYYAGDQTGDLTDYLNQVLVLTPQEFAAKYGNYSLVMTKYTLLQKALTAAGYK